MANEMMNIEEEINSIGAYLPNNNYVLGRGLAQPFNPANSGSRKLMMSIHREHLMVLDKGEIPICQTGYETEFGLRSSSIEKAESDYVVLYKIPKFSFKPEENYYLIIQDKHTGEYDYIHRVAYNHNTESYGYLFNNEYLDKLVPGSEIKNGDTIKKSNGFDEFNNKMDGINLTTMYLSCDQNMEDSVILSESAAEKLKTTLIMKPSITINDNDILLNLYGDENRYKTFPDIGEYVKNNIFCGIRRLENSNMFYTLAQSRLMDIMMSDKNIIINGKVMDINVFCNNPEALGDSWYNQQLYFYYNQNIEFCNAINNVVGPLKMNGKLSYKLEKLHSNCRDTVGGKQFMKEKQFNNVIIEVVIAEELPCYLGDKLSDRYGGKGVISEIRPDHLMPRLDNGKVVDIIKNQSTCINRENLGQLNEQSLTFIGCRLIDYFRTGVLNNHEIFDMWHKYVSFIDPKEADYIASLLGVNNNSPGDDYELDIFVRSLLEDDCIVFSDEPFTTRINLDTIADIYDEFPFIQPYRVSVPMEDSNGEIKYVETRRPLVIGKIYTYRLKQYAEEKFSVTSLSATNLKNLNARSRASKLYETKYTKTPIQFGAMEQGNLAHLGMDYVIIMLMLYSSSPQGRRLFEQLLTGDPYNVDIKLDSNSRNRNAEIINTIFKAMGIRLNFIKVPKKPNIMARKVMAKFASLRGYEYKTNVRDIIGHDDELNTHYKAALADRKAKPMARVIMAKKVDKK